MSERISFLSIDMSPIDAFDQECINQRMFEFKPKDQDYFCRFFVNWDVMTARVYTLQLGNRVFDVPSSFYIMIGDSYGEIDWMMVDEIINREVECVVLDDELESWNLFHPYLVDVQEKTFHWPMSQNIIPCENESGVVLLSKKDQYHLTKHFLIDTFLVSV